jgi:hypothetical protein
MALLPYYCLSRRLQRAEDSVLLPYAADHYSGFISSVTSGRFTFMAFSFLAILSDFLPLLLTNIPYNGATSYKAHRLCSWLSVGILTAMAAILSGALLFLMVRRPYLHFHPELIRKCPLVAALLLASISPDLIECSRDMAVMSTRTQRRRLKSMNLRFFLEGVGNWDSGSHTGVSVAKARA